MDLSLEMERYGPYMLKNIISDKWEFDITM